MWQDTLWIAVLAITFIPYYSTTSDTTTPVLYMIDVFGYVNSLLNSIAAQGIQEVSLRFWCQYVAYLVIISLLLLILFATLTRIVFYTFTVTFAVYFAYQVHRFTPIQWNLGILVLFITLALVYSFRKSFNKVTGLLEDSARALLANIGILPLSVIIQSLVAYFCLLLIQSTLDPSGSLTDATRHSLMTVYAITHSFFLFHLSSYIVQATVVRVLWCWRAPDIDIAPGYLSILSENVSQRLGSLVFACTISWMALALRTIAEKLYERLTTNRVLKYVCCLTNGILEFISDFLSKLNSWSLLFLSIDPTLNYYEATMKSFDFLKHNLGDVLLSDMFVSSCTVLFSASSTVGSLYLLYFLIRHTELVNESPFIDQILNAKLVIVTYYVFNLIYSGLFVSIRVNLLYTSLYQNYHEEPSAKTREKKNRALDDMFRALGI